MYLRHLQVSDFRSWAHADLELSPGPVVFVGRNGQGKTNLVEAIGYAATLGSHRVANDAPLIRDGAERAVVRAAVINSGRELLVELEITAGKANRARLNRAPVSRPRDVLGVLRTVLFAPEDLSLVKGDPSVRRKFLDDLLTSLRPRFAGVRADYEKVLKQRSALLKSASSARRSGRTQDLSTLDIWDGHLARLGADLLAGRLDLVTALAPHVLAAYADVAPESRPAQITYRCCLGDGVLTDEPADREMLEKLILDEIARRRTAEIERAVNLVGPHRDDLELQLGPHPAKGYASHGESWSYALALRLGSYQLHRASDVEPILILDDVFAELDRFRRSALAKVAAQAEQVIITAAVAEDIPEELRGQRFDIAQGTVTTGEELA